MEHALQVKQIKNRFQSVSKKLESRSWFKKEKWISSVHGYPNEANPDGITFYIFKKHWWNEDRQGIHIESYLDINEKKQKKTYVTIHLLHHSKIPGTNLKRITLTKPFIDAISKDVRKWPGYKFRAGKYEQQPFTKILDGTSATFERDLETEVERICTQLGPVLENCLRNIPGLPVT